VSSSITRILIVDDQELARRVLQHNIEETCGARVGVAVNGRQAFEQLMLLDFDLVITDGEMPELDGFELCRDIRQTPSLASIPVILTTGLGEEARARAPTSFSRNPARGASSEARSTNFSPNF
jgi:two-component system chemotaxis sensor kinase CheA